MTSTFPCVLSMNVGSSSLRFGVHEVGETTRALVTGAVERIGARDTTFNTCEPSTAPAITRAVAVGDHAGAGRIVLDWLDAQPIVTAVAAAGHRVVHGLHRVEPELVTTRLIASLRQLTPYAPDHLPGAVAMIEAIAARHPRLPQVACFDTAFHRTMPRVATLLALPRRFDAAGVRRYGFHGLSCAFLMAELARLGDPAATTGRVILAHLGSGASVTAVRDGRSIDTSMGFTPASGLPMSTRAGDLDPGLVDYVARVDGMAAPAFHHMVTHTSGLLGVSETSGDMRDLLAAEDHDVRAAEAVALFCYHARKWIGAFAAALGGVDTLVFAGGIGEHAATIRERICDGLGFLGIDLDEARNAAAAGVISTDTSRATVRIIHTDEALMIARSVVGSGCMTTSGRAGQHR